LSTSETNRPAVTNVFVLMLENHSFDNIFAFSEIEGITCASTSDSNRYCTTDYAVGTPAPPSMPTDPGHEFLDVVEQLCGEGTRFASGQPYPKPITNSGFVANYATTTSEKPDGNPNLPTPAQRGDIMLCFDTKNQLPVIYSLARDFAICDQWFSSIPGPTWPNRFFVHGASSGGWADTPSNRQIENWETWPHPGFTYPGGSSIFDRMTSASVDWCIFRDGITCIPQVTALKNVHLYDAGLVSNLATDLQNPYPYAYTFIEPNYGDAINGSYKGGSSQHPRDGVASGESLIKTVYEAIRNSPLWEKSLLIVTYDEHGGFYDSVAPGSALPPDDGSPFDPSINASGFMFDEYGVRVPALVVSPLVPKGKVDHTVYDHTTVLATLERLFGLQPLTKRDENANDVLGLLSLGEPRTDCPTTLPDPPPDAAEAAGAALAAPAAVDEEPLPETGNVHGFLQVLLKTDLELAKNRAERDEIAANFNAIETRGDARRYSENVMSKVEAEQARRGAV
jgi:phospholipase C